MRSVVGISGLQAGEDVNDALLERIASALERIASALEAAPAPQPPAPQPPPPPQPTALPQGQSLIDYLAARNIRPRDPIAAQPQEENGEADLDALAWLIGERWANVKPLIEAVKARLSSGDALSLNLRGQGEAVISDTCAIAHRAHALGLLEEYRYHRSPVRRLDARPSRAPVAQRFWAGGWLERWARQVALRAVAQLRPGAAWTWLANLPVILPTGEGFEIDFLLATTDGTILWIETKSGDYQEHLDKYSRVRRMLGLPSSNAIILLAHPQAPHRALSGLYALTVCGLDEFPARVALALGENEKSAASTGPENEKTPAE
jgi:hypothetical protein